MTKKKTFTYQDHELIHTEFDTIYKSLARLSKLANSEDFYKKDVKPIYVAGEAINTLDYKMRELYRRDRYTRYD